MIRALLILMFLVTILWVCRQQPWNWNDEDYDVENYDNDDDDYNYENTDQNCQNWQNWWQYGGEIYFAKRENKDIFVKMKTIKWWPEPWWYRCFWWPYSDSTENNNETGMMIEIMMMVIMMMTIMIMTKILTKIVNAGAKQTMASVLSQWLNLFFLLSLVSENNANPITLSYCHLWVRPWSIQYHCHIIVTCKTRLCLQKWMSFQRNSEGCSEFLQKIIHFWVQRHP